MKHRILCWLSFASCFCMLSCVERYTTIHQQMMMIDKNKLQDDSLIKYPGTNSYFSRIKEHGSFGRRMVFPLNEKQERKEFYIVFTGKIRSNYPQSKSTITVVTNDKSGAQIDWRCVFLKTFYTEMNRWCYFKDSVKITVDERWRKHRSITCFPFLPSGTGEAFDIDSLYVSINEIN